jgi:8-oxo-dGTP diphosphatase
MINCTFPNGNPAQLRHVTCDAIAVQNNEVLLVKRAATSLFEPMKYAFPGGYVDRDEFIEDAVLRELFEETGYRGKVQLLFVVRDDPEREIITQNQNISFFYLIDVFERTGRPDHEIENVTWFALNNLPPAAEFAFDHFYVVSLLKKYLRKKFTLPIIGKYDVRK